ncbi:DUF2171 domain-containing protein [Sphingomonas mali]|uniref:DUF2171 domain-containing protein n=1 Tax=Sphingomonas mali TaxID=40682 RepID=UPI00082B2FB1|nr:DUF2171 domain-containing protein [Sphingomonas mali]
MSQLNNVRADMAVIGADGVAVGTVDSVTHHSIKLRPTGVRGEEGDRAHFIPAGLIAEIEGDTVRLSANADVAVTFEDEQV